MDRQTLLRVNRKNSLAWTSFSIIGHLPPFGCFHWFPNYFSVLLQNTVPPAPQFSVHQSIHKVFLRFSRNWVIFLPLLPSHPYFFLSIILRGFSWVAQLRPTLCNPMNCSTPGLPVHHQPLESTQTHVHRVDDAIQPSYPVVPFSYPQIFPSIRVFSNESALRIRWPKYWVLASTSVLPNKAPPIYYL